MNLPDRELEESVEDVARGLDGWKGLQGARILLTGGTGFFGRWLIETFLLANSKYRLGASLTVLSRSADGFRATMPHLQNQSAIDFVQGDIRTFSLQGSVTHVIHAATAASAPTGPLADLETFETIVMGTRNVLRVALAAKAKRFLFVSSGACYGPQPLGVNLLDETFSGAPDTLAPSSAYAEGKRAAEQLCTLMATPEMEVVVARPFAFVGPLLPLDAKFAIGNFIRDALSGKSIVIKGDGQPLRSYMYSTDLTTWLWTLLLNGKSGRAYNVGSEQAYSLLDVANEVARQTQQSVKVLTPSSANAPPPRYVPSTSRARLELKLFEKISLREAISRTLEWHKPRFQG